MKLVHRIVHRLRIEARAAVQLYALPFALALLPTRYAMRLSWRLAKYPWFYRDEWTQALPHAIEAGMVAAPEIFAHEFRWFRLLDHLDCWLGMTRTARWHQRRVDVRGTWPQQPCVGVFFHVGPHAWAVRAARAEGHRGAVVIARFSRITMGGALLAYWYGRIRVMQLGFDTGRAVLFPPGTLEQARREFALGNWVWVMPDVPVASRAADAKRAHPFAFANTTIQFPTGLAEIARRNGVPIVVVVLAIRDDGRRELTIGAPISPDDTAAAMEHVTSTFREAVQARPASFFLWPAMPALSRRD